MRPLYETATDLRAEGEIAAIIGKRLHLRLFKLPIAYGLDFVGTDALGRFVAWFEVKDRHGFRWGQYSTVMLSVLKVKAAYRLTDAFELPALFIVRDVTGDIRGINFSTIQGRSDWLRWGGRTRATRDSGDIEPVAHIPIDLFHPLGLEILL